MNKWLRRNVPLTINAEFFDEVPNKILTFGEIVKRHYNLEGRVFFLFRF